MAINFRKFFKGLNLVPNSSSQVSAKGDVEVLDASGKINMHNGSSASPVVTEAHAADITNKTLLEVDNLRLDGNTVSAKDANGNLILNANGSGQVQVSTGDVVVSTSLTVDVLKLDSNVISNTATDTPTQITTTGTGNADIRLLPAGTGTVYLGSANIQADNTGILTVSGQLNADNVRLDGSTVSSVNLNTDLTLSANGTGSVAIENLAINTNTLSSTNTNGNIIIDPNGTGEIRAESQIRVPEIATPSTPASGYGSIYFKTDGNLYQLDDTGAESRLGNLAQLAVTSKTTTYTATTADDVILVSASGGSWTLSLYTAVGNSGRRIRIKRTDQTLANQVTIDANGTETIDGSLTRKLSTQYEEYEIVSDGSNWHILDHQIPSTWTSYTLTGSFTGNTTYAGYWRRVGDSAEIQARATFTGAPTPSVALTFNLPSNMTIDVNKLASSNNGNVNFAGGCRVTNGSGQSFSAIAITYNTTTSVLPRFDAQNATSYDDGSFTPTNPYTFVSGGSVNIIYRVPITNWEG